MNAASSKTLLPLNIALENSMLFLCFHMDHIKANHQHCHLLTLMPSAKPDACWRKCCLGVCGKAPCIFSQDRDSHQIGWILLQWMNKWAASSSMHPQNGQDKSLICTCRLCKFVLVGNLSLSNLQAKTEILLGIFIFHSS